MGLFDGIKGRVAQKDFEFDIQHSLVLVLLSSVYADDWEAQQELLVLRQILSKSPIFAESNDANDRAIVERCKQYLSTHPDALSQACASLPVELKKTAFVMALEIVFADGLIHQQEEAFINLLKSELKIDSNFARGSVETFEALYAKAS